jgi:ferredoxin
MEGKSYIKKGSWLGYTFPHIITSKKILRDTRPWDKDFSAGDKCSGCGICKNICPAQNIQLTDHKPEFMHKCLLCMACIQYCPRKAIKYKGRYIEIARYYHPEISINEISEFNSR